MFECAQKDGNPINKIFCIVSEDVYTKKKKVEEKTGTSYELFIKENVDVINESRKDDEKIEIIPIYYDFKPGSSEKVDDYALYIKCAAYQLLIMIQRHRYILITRADLEM